MNKSIKSIEYFSFSLGGYFSENYEIEFKDGIVKFSKSDGPWPAEKVNLMMATPEQVEPWIIDLNKLGILSWKKKYANDTCDGTQWSVEIKYNGTKTKKSWGSNEFPNPDDDALYSKDFDQLLRILNTMLGKKLFLGTKELSPK